MRRNGDYPRKPKPHLGRIANGAMNRTGRRGGEPERKDQIMKTILVAAATVLSLGVGSAFATESGSQAGGYVYPEYQFPTNPAQSATTAQGGEAFHAYISNSGSGTWLFPPNPNQGGNS
jgi:hypothetical protein